MAAVRAVDQPVRAALGTIPIDDVAGISQFRRLSGEVQCEQGRIEARKQPFGDVYRKCGGLPTVNRPLDWRIGTSSVAHRFLTRYALPLGLFTTLESSIGDQMGLQSHLRLCCLNNCPAVG